MARYRYSGPVLIFDKVVDQNWTAETYAISPARARSNLSYRYKKEIGLVPGTKLTLPGKIEKID